METGPILEVVDYSGGFTSGAGEFTPVLKRLHTRHDWQEYGGAPLLGVGGYCLICHGRSESRSIMNAIRVGKQLVLSGVNQAIVARIEKSIQTEEDDPKLQL